MDEMATDIGSRLRHAREQRQLTLRDIANTTKISTAALNAIEHNDFARLPGGVFRTAYVRVYAAEVGLDPEELMREYRARFETEIPDGPPPQESVWHDRLRPLHRRAAVLVSVGGILIGGSVIVKRAQIPNDSQDQKSTVNTVEADRPEETASTDEPEATDIALTNAAVTRTSAHSLRLEIRLDGPCWVSAVADGDRVIHRLMQQGERTLVEARSAITLHVGDAGTVAYSINGVAGRPLGGSGEVVTVHITNDNLQSLYAQPESATSPNGTATRIG